jgi:hypothetical protein
MLLDFEVQRCTRRCAATDRALEPGEECYSVLVIEGANVIRKDFSSEVWKAPIDGAFGWWKSRVPEPTAKKIKLAPNEVLLGLFEKLADQSDQQDLRYVLALLLVRRRVLKVDVSQEGFEGNAAADAIHQSGQCMTLYSPKHDASYEVVVDMPTGERVDEIQHKLSDLLIADAA